MAANENPRQPLINPFVSGQSSHAKYTEPSTTLDMTSKPTATKIIGEKSKRVRRIAPSKQSSVNDIYMTNLRNRLSARKVLHNRLILSIILMMIENEITFRYAFDKDTPISWWIKLMITFLTVILVSLVLVYHRWDLALYAVNNTAEDWRVGLTYSKIFIIIIEVIVCAIHPFPRSYPTGSRIFAKDLNSDSTSPTPYPLTYLSLDVALGLPMFFRLYLLCRCVIYHSHLVRNSSSQSIGCLNRISINFPFLARTYLEQSPTLCLLTISGISFCVGSWGLRASNYDDNQEHFTFADSMWLFIGTFTANGYGDLYPTTHYGRTVAVICGVVGLLVSALIIAVLTQKLELERAEKYFNTFVMNMELAQERKTQSANVIKYALKLWALKRKEKSFASVHYLQTQRKLFEAIHNIQETKQEQKDLVDSCVGRIELVTMQRKTLDRAGSTNRKIEKLESKVDQIEEQLGNMNNAINNIQTTLNILVTAMASEKKP